LGGDTKPVEAWVEAYHWGDQHPSKGLGPEGQLSMAGENGRPSFPIAAFRTFSGSLHSSAESITTTLLPPHWVLPLPVRMLR